MIHSPTVVVHSARSFAYRYTHVPSGVQSCLYFFHLEREVDGIPRESKRRRMSTSPKIGIEDVTALAKERVQQELYLNDIATFKKPTRNLKKFYGLALENIKFTKHNVLWHLTCLRTMQQIATEVLSCQNSGGLTEETKRDLQYEGLRVKIKDIDRFQLPVPSIAQELAELLGNAKKPPILFLDEWIRTELGLHLSMDAKQKYSLAAYSKIELRLDMHLIERALTDGNKSLRSREEEPDEWDYKDVISRDLLRDTSSMGKYLRRVRTETDADAKSLHYDESGGCTLQVPHLGQFKLATALRFSLVAVGEKDQMQGELDRQNQKWRELFKGTDVSLEDKAAFSDAFSYDGKTWQVCRLETHITITNRTRPFKEYAQTVLPLVLSFAVPKLLRSSFTGVYLDLPFPLDVVFDVINLWGSPVPMWLFVRFLGDSNIISREMVPSFEALARVRDVVGVWVRFGSPLGQILYGMAALVTLYFFYRFKVITLLGKAWRIVGKIWWVTAMIVVLTVMCNFTDILTTGGYLMLGAVQTAALAVPSELTARLYSLASALSSEPPTLAGTFKRLKHWDWDADKREEWVNVTRIEETAVSRDLAATLRVDSKLSFAERIEANTTVNEILHAVYLFFYEPSEAVKKVYANGPGAQSGISGLWRVSDPNATLQTYFVDYCVTRAGGGILPDAEAVGNFSSHLIGRCGFTWDFGDQLTPDILDTGILWALGRVWPQAANMDVYSTVFNASRKQLAGTVLEHTKDKALRKTHESEYPDVIEKEKEKAEAAKVKQENDRKIAAEKRAEDTRRRHEQEEEEKRKRDEEIARTNAELKRLAAETERLQTDEAKLEETLVHIDQSEKEVEEKCATVNAELQAAKEALELGPTSSAYANVTHVDRLRGRFEENDEFLEDRIRLLQEQQTELVASRTKTELSRRLVNLRKSTFRYEWGDLENTSRKLEEKLHALEMEKKGKSTLLSNGGDEKAGISLDGIHLAENVTITSGVSQPGTLFGSYKEIESSLLEIIEERSLDDILSTAASKLSEKGKTTVLRATNVAIAAVNFADAISQVLDVTLQIGASTLNFLATGLDDLASAAREWTADAASQVWTSTTPESPTLASATFQLTFYVAQAGNESLRLSTNITFTANENQSGVFSVAFPGKDPKALEALSPSTLQNFILLAASAPQLRLNWPSLCAPPAATTPEASLLILMKQLSFLGQVQLTLRHILDPNRGKLPLHLCNVYEGLLSSVTVTSVKSSTLTAVEVKFEELRKRLRILEFDGTDSSGVRDLFISMMTTNGIEEYMDRMKIRADGAASLAAEFNKVQRISQTLRVTLKEETYKTWEHSTKFAMFADELSTYTHVFNPKSNLLAANESLGTRACRPNITFAEAFVIEVLAGHMRWGMAKINLMKQNPDFIVRDWAFRRFYYSILANDVVEASDTAKKNYISFYKAGLNREDFKTTEDHISHQMLTLMYLHRMLECFGSAWGPPAITGREPVHGSNQTSCSPSTGILPSSPVFSPAGIAATTPEVQDFAEKAEDSAVERLGVHTFPNPAAQADISKTKLAFYAVGEALQCLRLQRDVGDIMSVLRGCKTARECAMRAEHPVIKSMYQTVAGALLQIAGIMMGTSERDASRFFGNLEEAGQLIGTALHPVYGCSIADGPALFWQGSRLYDSTSPSTAIPIEEADKVIALSKNGRVSRSACPITDQDVAHLRDLDYLLASDDGGKTQLETTHLCAAFRGLWERVSSDDGEESHSARDDVKEMARSYFKGDALAIGIVMSLFAHACDTLRRAKKEKMSIDIRCVGRTLPLRSDAFRVVGSGRVAAIFQGTILSPAIRDKAGNVHQGIACVL